MTARRLSERVIADGLVVVVPVVVAAAGTRNTCPLVKSTESSPTVAPLASVTVSGPAAPAATDPTTAPVWSRNWPPLVTVPSWFPFESKTATGDPIMVGEGVPADVPPDVLGEPAVVLPVVVVPVAMLPVVPVVVPVAVPVAPEAFAWGIGVPNHPGHPIGTMPKGAWTGPPWCPEL